MTEGLLFYIYMFHIYIIYLYYKSLSPTEVKSDDRQGGRGVCGNYKRKLKFSCSPELYSDNLNPISEKAMATHSSTLAWKIPWVEEPDRLQSMGSLGVRHD